MQRWLSLDIRLNIKQLFLRGFNIGSRAERIGDHTDIKWNFVNRSVVRRTTVYCCPYNVFCSLSMAERFSWQGRHKKSKWSMGNKPTGLFNMNVKSTSCIRQCNCYGFITDTRHNLSILLFSSFSWQTLTYLNNKVIVIVSQYRN